MKTITLTTDHATYQMGVTDAGRLLHTYFGPRVPDDMGYAIASPDRPFSGNPADGLDLAFSLDVLPLEYPTYGVGDYRRAALDVRTADGTDGCDLRVVSWDQHEGKYALDGLPAVHAAAADASTLEVKLADELIGLEVTLRYGVIPGLDAICRSATVTNVGTEPLVVSRALSASLDLVGGPYDLITFPGRYGMERIPERSAVGHALASVGSIRGASSHQANPFAILAEHGCDEDHGTCWSMSFLYSGNFTCEAQQDQFGMTRWAMGLSDQMFEYPLAPGESLVCPEVAMAFSADGLAHLSHLNHRLVREHVCRGPWALRRRPVLINNWEATGFDFTGEKIYDIAREAADLGIEMVVLDDGWFGARDGDRAGLGDWVVNEGKLGGTLGELSRRIEGLGMGFGLWIEPEMVNEDSDLYRAHPDWALTVPGREPIRGRNQLVLDFSRPEVVDAVFEAICKVVDAAHVSYLKMDCNRSMADVYSHAVVHQSFGKTMYRFVLGTYSFLERLIERYPQMLIEGCCGGGGRFDAGMMYYTPQVWCSDDTDAIERVRIQGGTSYGYPASAVGSHVSAVPNAQIGRSVDLETRGVVAMSGTFGYELDPARLTDAECDVVRRQVVDYKRLWPLIAEGDYYRLGAQDGHGDFAAWGFVSPDAGQALLDVVSLDARCNAPVSYVRCKGLDPAVVYSLELLCGEGGGQAMPTELSGAALMACGVPVPQVPGEYHAWQWVLSARG
ncbi:MAG: alpha-galactosidase [Atopobiaceae bacterium]|jgi:alpha-galactosidase|nr:alpha-galactosidase [Atopobiaceae bacterium]